MFSYPCYATDKRNITFSTVDSQINISCVRHGKRDKHESYSVQGTKLLPKRMMGKRCTWCSVRLNRFQTCGWERMIELLKLLASLGFFVFCFFLNTVSKTKIQL